MAKTRKETNAEWDAKNLKRFSISMKMELYEKVKRAAENDGKPINRYIMDIVKNHIETSK
ncbi:MAG: hypothetical protein IJN82_04480 [Clostridia bacterium]|nr:hypothetical protein [Clostridia bacterium]